MFVSSARCSPFLARGSITRCIDVGAGGRHFVWSSAWHTCWERFRFATVAWLLKYARHALKLQRTSRRAIPRCRKTALGYC